MKNNKKNCLTQSSNEVSKFKKKSQVYIRRKRLFCAWYIFISGFRTTFRHYSCVEGLFYFYFFLGLVFLLLPLTCQMFLFSSTIVLSWSKTSLSTECKSSKIQRKPSDNQEKELINIIFKETKCLSKNYKAF